jgi:hypothetical protein
MVFKGVALLLAGGFAVKFVLKLQDEDDAARDGEPDPSSDVRLGRVRPATSKRERAASATDEEARAVATTTTAPSIERITSEVAARTLSIPEPERTHAAIGAPVVEDSPSEGNPSGGSFARLASPEPAKKPNAARVVTFLSPEPTEPTEPMLVRFEATDRASIEVISVESAAEIGRAHV